MVDNHAGDACQDRRCTCGRPDSPGDAGCLGAVDVTVDGYAGKSITLHVPDDAFFPSCDQGYFGSWRAGDDPTPSRYHQAPGQIDTLWILDVKGELVVIDTGHYAGTPQVVIDELRAIVNSITFE